VLVRASPAAAQANSEYDYKRGYSRFKCQAIGRPQIESSTAPRSATFARAILRAIAKAGLSYTR
jgi:hypothetical protein